MPEKSIAMPHSLAFFTESSSRTLPPGCTIAVTPISLAKVTQSSNGKNASDANTKPSFTPLACACLSAISAESVLLYALT